MTNPTALPPQVAELSAALSQPRPMRRGSVNERRMKCGQANRACQRDPKARHGPYYTLALGPGRPSQKGRSFLKSDFLFFFLTVGSGSADWLLAAAEPCR